MVSSSPGKPSPAAPRFHMMERTFPVPPSPVSKKTFAIAGILVTVYGLDELSCNVEHVASLYLLHPRLQTQTCMEQLAASSIQGWNYRLQQSKTGDTLIGLIAVSFDQRNHGSRQVKKLANEDWRSGNATHAQDMFSVFHGTAVDVSLLITHLSSYIFPTASHTITTNLVCGVSLGGHGAWHCILQDPRITAAIIVIGCPDYISLMSDRARLSKIDSWTSSSPPGLHFLGSKDFPTGLIEAVQKYDPAGLFMAQFQTRTDENYTRIPSDLEKENLTSALKRSLQGKRILNLAGGADKLVPHRFTKSFLNWLKDAASPHGIFGNEGLVVEEIVYDGVGHEMAPAMVNDVDQFIAESLRNWTIEPLAKLSKI